MAVIIEATVTTVEIEAEVIIGQVVAVGLVPAVISVGDSHVPTPVGQVDGKMLATASDALVYVDAPSGGGGGDIPLPFVTGGWYSLAGGTANNNTASITAVGRMTAHPAWLQAGNYDRLAIEHGAGGDAVLRLGIYDGDVTGPGNVINDAGTISYASTSGFREIATTFTLPSSGIYWLAALCEAYTTNATTVGWVGTTNAPRLPWLGMSMYGGISGRQTFAVRVDGLSSGSLPSTFPTSGRVLIDVNTPQIQVRKAA